MGETEGAWTDGRSALARQVICVWHAGCSL